ncbi:STAS domain-containing protein [Pseudoxanthomonas sp. J35]|uniref:STAS domain-containing protein n=1 Tax=Pseudoxanthomonas sp. J35 TaxID=935852 RepID=UPI00048DBD50|nr:STAS domain-containing protein [Pseudoxanthomonas sp. J35]
MITVPLGEDLGIEASAELKERLAAHLSEPALALDGSAVRHVHTAGMQVLCAFFRTRGGLGRRTELRDSSQALRDAARLLGLSAQLGLPPQDAAVEKQTVENAA